MFKKLLRKFLPAPVAAVADEVIVAAADKVTHGAASEAEKVVKKVRRKKG